MQEMEVDSWAGTARSITVHAAQTVTDFADASHSESAKSTTTTVLYGIFSSENSYPCTVTHFGLPRKQILRSQCTLQKGDFSYEQRTSLRFWDRKRDGHKSLQYMLRPQRRG